MSKLGFWNDDLGFAKDWKRGIILFQDKVLLPTTKQCVNGHNMTLYSYKKEHFWKCNNRPCLKKVNLHVNTWFGDTRILLIWLFYNFPNKYYIFIIFCFISLALSKVWAIYLYTGWWSALYQKFNLTTSIYKIFR